MTAPSTRPDEDDAVQNGVDPTTAAGDPPAGRAHPLDPLSAAEMTAVAAVVKGWGEIGAGLRFVTVTLREPSRTDGPRSTDAAGRRADVVAYSGAERLIYELVVSLTAGEVESAVPVPGRFPPVMDDEFEPVEELVRADPRWQAAMRSRGVEDFSLCMIDPWPAGFTGPGDDAANGSVRKARPLTYVRSSPGEHGYARPVEGLIVTVDIDAMRVVDLEDHGVVPLPPHPGNYDPARMFDPLNRPAFEGFRTGVKPIEVTQPEGPGFTVDGWGVHWQKWSLRIGFTPREGIVLYDVAYDDRGRRRPVLNRASLSEMVVPYGDTAPTHWNKNVFDQGEVGMGLMANALTLGCDCLGHIHYFDGVVNGADGSPRVIPNAICLHEEDAGIAWKHTDFRTGDVEVRRSRRLVVSSVCTVGNYEYGFFWYLYTDGAIEFEVKLTGVISTGALAPGSPPPAHGVVVAPGLYGPHHQHFFSVRLDLAVDGPGNTVYEVDSVPAPPELNPHRNAWVTVASPVVSEAVGGRDADPGRARYWVVDSTRLNELGRPTGYRLLPPTAAPPMMQPGSTIHDRARFVQHALWVTARDRRERYAAGDYPYQSPLAQGLPEWVADDAPLVDADLVAWVTVGAHHVVRPEDWPVMPVTTAGFHLKPDGFFDGNPALDLPPSTPHGPSGRHCDGECHCAH